MTTGRKRTAKTEAIVVKPLPKPANPAELVNAGVAAFIPKDATLGDFLHTIRSAAKGNTSPRPPETASSPSQERQPPGKGVSPDQITTPVCMSRREQNVIDLIGQGRSNKEIADLLCIAITTVRTHVHNILHKLSLLTRIELAVYARVGNAPT